MGGVERKIVDIARYLAAKKEYKDLRVCLVLDDTPPLDSHESMFFEAVENLPIEIVYRSREYWWKGSMFLPLYLVWIVLTLRPTVILAFLRRFGIIAVLLKSLFWWRDIRVVISEDTFPSFSLADQAKNRWEHFILLKLMRACYAKSSVVISPSDAAKHDLIKNFHTPQESIVVNKNWTFVPPIRDPQPHKFDLIFVGRLDQVKNPGLFVEIVRDVWNKMPQVRACIVGSGDELQSVSQFMQANNLNSIITLAGFQRSPGKYLLASKLFCLTSHYEGLPISALEAMAHGLPVITTAYPGAEEVVREGGTGHICKGRREYVAKVIHLLTHEQERAEMGQRAREYVKMHRGEENLQTFVRLILEG